MFSFTLQYFYVSFLFAADHESSASAEPIISPIILNMWVLHISDPFICIDAIEVLEVVLQMLLTVYHKQ